MNDECWSVSFIQLQQSMWMLRTSRLCTEDAKHSRSLANWTWPLRTYRDVQPLSLKTRPSLRPSEDSELRSNRRWGSLLSKCFWVLVTNIWVSKEHVWFSPQLKTTFSTDSRVQNMFDILFSDESDKEKREKVWRVF